MKKFFLVSLSGLMFCVLSISVNAAGPTMTETSTLDWTANTDLDIAGYRLYYSPTSEGQTIPGIADVIIPHPTVTHTLGTLVIGQYYVKITAYDQSGNESAASTEVPFVFAAGEPSPTIPLPPSNLTLQNF